MTFSIANTPNEVSLFAGKKVFFFSVCIFFLPFNSIIVSNDFEPQTNLNQTNFIQKKKKKRIFKHLLNR